MGRRDLLTLNTNVNRKYNQRRQIILMYSIYSLSMIYYGYKYNWQNCAQQKNVLTLIDWIPNQHQTEQKHIQEVPINLCTTRNSENADTSASVTVDLYVWPWPYFKIKKAYVIRCPLLYWDLVLGLMFVIVIICEIWPLIHFCDLQLMSRSLSL